MKAKAKFRDGQLVLVRAKVITEYTDGLVKVSILDGKLPRVMDCFIWHKSLRPLTAKERSPRRRK